MVEFDPYSGTMAGQRGPREITPEHKAAMAQGRADGRVVRDYLEALRAIKPKRGRKRTPESIKAQLEKIEAELVDASPIKELDLIQMRRDLNEELKAGQETVDISALETDFVGVAQRYSARKGISYASWRDVGVPAAVLKRAGISRSDR